MILTKFEISMQKIIPEKTLKDLEKVHIIQQSPGVRKIHLMNRGNLGLFSAINRQLRHKIKLGTDNTKETAS